MTHFCVKPILFLAWSNSAKTIALSVCFFAYNDDGGNCIAARRPKLFPVNNGQIKQLPKDVFAHMKYQAFLTQTHDMEFP